MPTKKEIVKFWRNKATDDRITAKALLKSKRYSACLFFVHIYLEKMLKALVVEKTGKPAPFVHDLLDLANIAKIKLSEEQKEMLREINTFNIRARYDNYKSDFCKRATKNYTIKHFELANKLYLWLGKKFIPTKK
ncbi:MAG: HEPN domain-containing protein [Candidatus Pacebacteria bacterium]|nr:HEPN domain-containing protein [Candidatus Paceibacterota bacterium]